MDLSQLVAWGTPVLAGISVAALGLRRAGSGSKTGIGAALGTALGIGVLFMFIQVALHGACVGSTFCEDRGDGNMSYWFQSLFAFPVYWLICYLAAQRKK